jgi:hypothetical protein
MDFSCFKHLLDEEITGKYVIIFLFTAVIRKLRTKYASGDPKLKFDELYCINEMLENDILLVFKILLGYEKLAISHGSQILTHKLKQSADFGSWYYCNW